MAHTQLISLSEEAMLILWKRCLGLVHERINGEIVRADDDVWDELILPKMRAWYDNLLTTASPDLLPTEDLAPELTLKFHLRGSASVALPDRYVRPVEWQLDAWRHPVRNFREPEDLVAVMQSNDFLMAGNWFPVVVEAHSRMLLYPALPNDVLEYAECVVRPANGMYVLAPQLLNTIPSSLD